MTRVSPNRSEASLLGLYLNSLEYRTAVDTIADLFSGVEFYGVDASGERLPADHPLNRLIANPNPEITGTGWRLLYSAYLDTTANVFDLVEVAENGTAEVWALPSTWVTPKSDGRAEYELDLEVQYPSGQRVTYPRERVAWDRVINPGNPYGRGVGRGVAASDDAMLSEAAAGYTTGFFRNNAAPSLLVHIPGAKQESLTGLQASWNGKHQGRSFTTHFLGGQPGSKMTVERLQTDFKDLGVVELRQVSFDYIRQLYRVPPELIGQLTSSNRATITEAIRILAITTLQPRAARWAGYMNERIIPRIAEQVTGRARREWEGVRVAFTSPVPDDVEARREMMAQHPEAFTVNEIRGAAGLPARADGDVYIRTSTPEQIVEAGDVVDLTAQARMMPPPIPKDAVLYLLPDPDPDTEELEAEGAPVLILATDGGH